MWFWNVDLPVHESFNGFQRPNEEVLSNEQYSINGMKGKPNKISGNAMMAESGRINNAGSRENAIM